MAVNTYNQIHRYGTQAQYDALTTKNDNYLYFTSDTHKLYKGSVDYTDNLISVSSVPATGVAGKIYFESSTGQVKAYIGGAWEVISYPISQDIDGLNASSYAVPSEAAVVDYVADVIGTSSDVVKAVSQKMNAGTAVAGQLEVTKADDSTVDVKMVGLAVNPTWNSATRQLTIPVTKADGTTENVVADIGKDIFLQSGYYDSDSKEIVLVLNDDPEDPTEVRVPASALYNDYTGGSTSTAEVSIDGTTHEITVSVNNSTVAGNAIEVKSDGIYLSLDAYATTASVDGIRSNLQGQIDATTATLAATTASLGTLTDNYNATTAELAALEGNYNNTTAALSTLTSNYNATTTALDTLTSNYNATTAQVADNTTNIANLATAATTWAGFTD